MLYNTVQTCIEREGLDPCLGVLHRDKKYMPTLVFDVIEAFRPYVDRFVSDFLFTHNINTVDFIVRSTDNFILSKSGKRKLIPEYNRWLDQIAVWPIGRSKRINLIQTYVYNIKKNISQVQL